MFSLSVFCLSLSHAAFLASPGTTTNMATVTEWSTSSATCLAERNEGPSVLPCAPRVPAFGSPSKEGDFAPPPGQQ